MAKVIRNLFKVYIDTDWKVTNTIPAPIAAFGNGQTSIRIVSAEASPAEYTGILTFILASGQEYTGSPVPILIPNGVEEVNGEDWFVWDYPLNKFITSNSSKNADGTLYFTSIFTNIEDTDNVNPQIPQSSATISASTQKVDVILSPDDVQNLTGMIQQKRDKKTDALSGIDSTKTNVITYDELEGDVEKKETRDDLIQAAIDAFGGTSDFLALPTDGPAGITSPLTGNPVTRTVSSIDDPDFDKVTPVPISHVLQATGVWEIAFESVYEIGFAGATGSLSSIEFTQNVFAGKIGGNIELRTRYFTYDAINGLLPVTVPVEDTVPFHVGTVINITSDILAGYSKVNLVLALDIDPSELERIYTVTEVRGTSGDTAFAEIEDGVNTFSSWKFQTSPAIENKITKVGGATEDNLSSFTPDGGLKDSGVGSADVMLKSVELPLLILQSEKNANNGVAGLDANGHVFRANLPAGIKILLGTFGSGVSTTGGDLPSAGNTIGDAWLCDEDGFVSTEAGLTFDNGDMALFDTNSNWVKQDNTEAVKSVNGKTGVVVLTTLDLGDMPSSIPIGSEGDHLVVNATNNGYVLSVANNNTSTAVISGMQVSMGAGVSFNVASGVYAIVDYADPKKPKTTRFTYAGSTNNAIPTIASGFITHVSIDNTQTLVLRNVELTDAQYRAECYLGILGHLDKATLTQSQSAPAVNNQPINTIKDLLDEAKIKKGILFSGVSALTRFKHSAGIMTGLGINADNNITNPNRLNFSATDPVTFTELWRDGVGGVSFEQNTDFDPNLYDNASGTRVVIPNPNNAVNHYIYVGTNSQIFIIRGQAFYADIATAQTAYLNQTDVITGIPEDIFDNAVLRAVVSLDKTATDFSNVAEALFYVPVVAVVGGGGDVGSVDDVNANNTSIVGDLAGILNLKLVNEMFEYKHIAFSQIGQFTIEDEITTAKAKVNNNVILKPFQKYTIQLPTFVSGNPIELSLDDGVTHLALVDESLVAIIGTDGADAKMEVFWNGASLVKFVSQELASKTSTSITENFELLSGTWALVVGGDFDGLYEYDISDAGVTATDIAEVWARQTTLTLFNDAQFSPENDTTAGILTVYCTVLPTVSIFINYTITKGVV